MYTIPTIVIASLYMDLNRRKIFVARHGEVCAHSLVDALRLHCHLVRYCEFRQVNVHVYERAPGGFRRISAFDVRRSQARTQNAPVGVQMRSVLR